MNRLLVCLVASALAWAVGPGPARADTASGPAPSLLRVYQVNKKVSDFPEKEDFSSPEAAYAAINRVIARGEQGAWRRISTRENARRLPPASAKKTPVKTETAEMWLNARILEVRIFKGRRAMVIAKIAYPSAATRFDERWVFLEEGKWLNLGQDIANSLEEARALFARQCAYHTLKYRPRIEDPASHLRPFIDFLQARGRDPRPFMIKALAEHKIVIMGEVHHRPLYWAFNASLVTHRQFPRRVGTIYMELPSNSQHRVEKFLAGRQCDVVPVIETFRDVLWMGWPDQPMLDFFVTVWMVNQSLPPDQKLRIVFVDMQRPWEKIRSAQDWLAYKVDRDRFMAENILKDVSAHQQERRNGLFIVGVGHSMLNLKSFYDRPVESAAWHVREKLGSDEVYSVFPHTCRMTNVGVVRGRICDGLFESAFAANHNRPVAFPLTVGPFGEQLFFDTFPDRRAAKSRFREGYSAYLYLGPLEQEFFSPMIASFYTDRFVKELDRRHRIAAGKGLIESYGLARVDAECFVEWMGRSWGKPRKAWRPRRLGPMDAWKYGSEWKSILRAEKHGRAVDQPEEIVKAAKRLFDAIRTLDYDRHASGRLWRDFPGDYTVRTDFPGWVRWICSRFKGNPIESVDLGAVFIGNSGLPTVPYKLTLKDETILNGELPFEYDPLSQSWQGRAGIDWHLRSKPTTRGR